MDSQVVSVLQKAAPANYDPIGQWMWEVDG